MDIRIIIVFILGLYQSFDTRGILSHDDKIILSNVLIIVGGVPVAIHLLVWLLGHGPKIKPIIDNALKLITMDFYPVVNTYLMLRNKGVYCSEQKRIAYYMTDDFYTDIKKSDKSPCISNEGDDLDYYIINEGGQINLLQGVHYGLSIKELVSVGNFSFTLRLGELVAQFRVHYKCDEVYNVTVKKSYTESIQSHTKVYALSTGELKVLLKLMQIREGKEILTNIRYSKLRRVNVSHSNSIDEVIKKIKLGMFKTMYLERLACYVEGTEKFDLQFIKEEMVRLGVWTKKQFQAIEEYMKGVGFDNVQKAKVVKWVANGCSNNYIRNVDCFNSRQKRRMIVDIASLTKGIGISPSNNKIFLDKGLKPRNSVNSIVELYKANDTLFNAEADLLISESVLEDKIRLLPLVKLEEQKVKDCAAGQGLSSGNAEKPKPEIKIVKKCPDKFNYSTILEKDGSNNWVYDLTPPEFKSKEELMGIINVNIAGKRRKFNCNISHADLTKTLRSASKYINLVEEFPKLRKIFNFKSEALEVIESLYKIDTEKNEGKIQPKMNKVDWLNENKAALYSYKDALLRVNSSRSVEEVEKKPEICRDKVTGAVSDLMVGWKVRSLFKTHLIETGPFQNKKVSPAIKKINELVGKGFIKREEIRNSLYKAVPKTRYIVPESIGDNKNYKRMRSVTSKIIDSVNLKKNARWSNFFNPLQIREFIEEDLKLDKDQEAIIEEIVEEVKISSLGKGEIQCMNLKAINKAGRSIFKKGVLDEIQHGKYTKKLRSLHKKIMGQGRGENCRKSGKDKPMNELKNKRYEIAVKKANLSRVQFLNKMLDEKKCLQGAMIERLKGFNIADQAVGERAKEKFEIIQNRMSKEAYRLLKMNQRGERRKNEGSGSCCKRANNSDNLMTNKDWIILDKLKIKAMVEGIKREEDEIKHRAERAERDRRQKEIDKERCYEEIKRLDYIEKITGVRGRLSRKMQELFDSL